MRERVVLTSSNWSLLGVVFSFLLSSAALVNSADMVAGNVWVDMGWRGVVVVSIKSVKSEWEWKDDGSDGGVRRGA